MGKFWGAAKLRTALMTAAASVVCAAPAFAQQQTQTFNIPAQNTAAALNEFSRQAGVQILFPYDVARRTNSQTLQGEFTRGEALRRLTEGTQLSVTSDDGRTIVLADSASPTQLGAADTGAEEEIVVTGTNIRGVAPDSSPLAIYSNEEMRATGATTTEQFFERLPVNSQSLFGGAPNSTSAFNPGGASGVDLRGLGVGTTVVLLNGRRLALGGASRSPDISMLPLEALERVEILPDGASSLYGADAIGGVVNFILRDDFQGAQTSLSYGGDTAGSFDQTEVAQTIGASWRSGSALLSYSYLSRSELDAGERDFSEAAAPYSLSPSEERNGVLLSLRQQGPAGFDLSADALLSSRDSVAYTTLSGGFEQSTLDSTSDQLFINLGASRQLFETFGLELAASYSELNTSLDQETTFFGFPFSFSDDFRDTVLDLSAKLDGSLFSLPGGPVRFALGAGATTQDFEQAGRFAVDRDITYIFGELNLPILSERNDVPFARRLELNLSARQTDYSDFGDEISPRVGLLWSPLNGLNLRATAGQSFRAPALANLNPNTAIYSIFQPSAFGFPDPFSPTGDSVLLLVNGVGRDGLEPETADNYTIGFDWEPAFFTGFRLSATYFNVKYADRILSPASPSTLPLFDPGPYADIISFNPSAAVIDSLITGVQSNFNSTGITDPAVLEGLITVLIDNRLANLAESNIDGLDVSADYRFGVGNGEFSLGAQGTFIFEYEQRITNAAAFVTVVDTVLHPPRFRGRFNLGYENGPWTTQLGVNYVDGYDNPFEPGSGSVDSWATLDWTLGFDFDQLGGDGGLRGLQLSLSAQNLTNEDPPFVPFGPSGSTLNAPVGYDPVNANPLGRVVTLRASKRW